MTRIPLLSFFAACAILMAPRALLAQSEDPTPLSTIPYKPVPPGEYLAQAESQLDAIPEAPLNHDAKKLLAALRHEFTDLEKAYRAHATGRNDEGAAAIDGNVSTTIDWFDHFYDVERRLTEILGGGSTLSPSPANPIIAPVPTPGTNASSFAPTTTVVPATPPPSAATAARTPARVLPAGASATTTPTTTTPAGAGAQNTPAAGVAVPTDAGGNPVSVTPSTPAGTGSGSAAGGANAVVASGSSAVAAAAVLAGQIGLKDLNPTVRDQLSAFRVSIELFFDATTRLGAY